MPRLNVNVFEVVDFTETLRTERLYVTDLKFENMGYSLRNDKTLDQIYLFDLGNNSTVVLTYYPNFNDAVSSFFNSSLRLLQRTH